jgi:hypothetical protein
MTRTGSLSKQHSQGKMRRGKPNTDPLRKVIRTGLGEYGNREELECGHLIVPPTDFIGETYATRRRCYYCATKNH